MSDPLSLHPRKRPSRLAHPGLSRLASALLLGWALLTSARASAAEVPSSPTAPSRALHLLDESDLRDDADPPRAEGTTALPLLSGALVGTVVGVGAGLGLVALGSSNLADSVLYFFLGANLGFPLGVWMGGALAGGEGWLGPTLAGAVPGVLFGVLTLATDKDGFAALFFLSSIFVTPALSLVGYALTDEYEHKKKRAAPRVQVQPLLGVSSERALVGLQGRF